MNQSTRRYRRGDTSPERPGLIYWCFNHTYEEWITPDAFTKRLAREAELYPAKKARQLLRHKQRYASDPEYRREHINKSMAHHKKHPEQQKKAMSKWLSKPGSREKSRAATKAWVNTPEGRKKRREITARYIATPNGAIINRVRSRMAVALKRGYIKSGRTLELLGCSIQEFRIHLEKQFEQGMSWNNMGSWEIDHRVPLSAFNLADPEQQRLGFNFHNCKPMWKKHNRAKSDFITHEGKTIRARELRKIIPFQTQAA